MLTKSFGIILGSFLSPRFTTIMSDLFSFTSKVYPALGHCFTSNLRQAMTWSSLLPCLHLDKHLFQQQNTKKLYEKLHSQWASRWPVPAGSPWALFWGKEEIPKTHLIKCCCLVRLLCPWDFPGRNIGMGCHFLLQEISPTHGRDSHILHWQAGSLPLSHQGRPIWPVITDKIITDKTFHSNERQWKMISK